MMCIAALCFFTSCSKTNDCCEIKPETKAEIELKTATNINNDLLLKMVNDLRVAGCNCGNSVMPPVGALTWNKQLASAAISHSEYMDSVKVMRHEAADGTKVGHRVFATNYNWSSVGENIARGYKTEEQVFKGWLLSEPHCRNMMQATFKEMGAAKVGEYWTQVFATKI